MTTVGFSAPGEGNSATSVTGTVTAVSMAPLVDGSKLISDPQDRPVLRAAHRIYEHLIAMFAPGIIDAAFELGVFTVLAEGPASAADLASQLDADPQGLRVLLDGLYSYEIVHRKTGDDNQSIYWLVDGMAECLLPNGLYSLAGRISYDRATGWAAWQDFAERVRRPAVDQGGEYQANQLSAKDYETVARGINFWAPPIVEALSEQLTALGWTVDGPRSMVDVGCGTGIYSHLLLQRFHRLRATGLDDERIAPIAREQGISLGVEDRFQSTVQNFFTGDWGTGHDLVLLANIYHLQTASGAEELTRNAVKALSDNGVIAIVDHIVDDRIDPLSIQNRFFRLFAASMLVTGGGDAYSLSDYDGWLTEAGLSRIALVDTPMHRILLAQRT